VPRITASSRVDKFSKDDIIVSPSILSANFSKLGEQVGNSIASVQILSVNKLLFNFSLPFQVALFFCFASRNDMLVSGPDWKDSPV
jgi:hypothetical protein